MARLISSSLSPFETHRDPVNDGADRFESSETGNLKQAGVQPARAYYLKNITGKETPRETCRQLSNLQMNHDIRRHDNGKVSAALAEGPMKSNSDVICSITNYITYDDIVPTNLKNDKRGDGSLRSRFSCVRWQCDVSFQRNIHVKTICRWKWYFRSEMSLVNKHSIR